MDKKGKKSKIRYKHVRQKEKKLERKKSELKLNQIRSEKKSNEAYLGGRMSPTLFNLYE